MIFRHAGAQRVLHHDQEDHRRRDAEDGVVHVPDLELAPVDASLEDAADQVLPRLDHLLLVEGGESGKLRASLMMSLVMPEARVAPTRSHQTFMQ